VQKTLQIPTSKSLRHIGTFSELLVAVSIRYDFSQLFRVSAAAAFRWCTDYSPADHALMGLKGKRKVKRLSEDTLILDDTLYPAGRAVQKTKLIRIDHKRMHYYNIHLTGPTKNSLYFYQIVPISENSSRLDYTAYEIYYPKKAPSAEQLGAIRSAESASWHTEWGNLARAMEQDVRGTSS